MEKSDLIIGVYYNRQPDTQRKKTIASNNYGYFKRWYESARSLGLKCLLLTDGSCSQEFIREHESDYLTIKVKESQHFTNTYTTRFLDVRKEITDQHSNVLLTDVSDLYFLRNPFDLVEENKLLVGVEQYHVDEKFKLIKDSKWCLREFKASYPDFPFWDNYIFNAGLIGGPVAAVNEFLSHYERIYFSRDWPDVCNCMVLLNLIVHEHFKGRIITGQPLHTVFKAYQHDHKAACVVHK